MSTAFFIFVIGVVLKVRQYWKTPAPLKIVVTPAPTTRVGVLYKMFREIFLFESLFRSNKWIWLFGYLFHTAMLIVLLRHIRYFTEPVWSWVTYIQPFGIYAGFIMAVSILGLWARRFLVARIRYISSLSDHLMLALFLGIVLSGFAMTYGFHTDIVALKAFTLGLLDFNWQPITIDPILLIHLGLVGLLFIIFPFSKLLHAPGLFFSPTQNQADKPGANRHLAAWAAKLDSRN